MNNTDNNKDHGGRMYIIKAANAKVFITAVLMVVFIIGSIFSMGGCFKIYPQAERNAQEGNIDQEFNGEEPPPEGEPQPEGEPPQEEPPPGEPPKEELQPNEQHSDQEPPPEEPKPTQPKVSEQEIKERCFHAAQYQIENHSIYKNVVFNTKFDENFMNKVTGFDYKYECGIEFTALDTNVNKNGWFVWTFVVGYDPKADSCYVETGAMQTSKY